MTRRIRLLFVSRTTRSPAGSSVRSPGRLTVATRSYPPSPEYDAVPVPRMVETLPPATLRTQFAVVSAMNTFPDESTARPPGWFSDTAVADPLRLHAVDAPPPATDATVVPLTSRTQLALVSAMKRLPEPSIANPPGLLSASPVAAPA